MGFLAPFGARRHRLSAFDCYGSPISQSVLRQSTRIDYTGYRGLCHGLGSEPPRGGAGPDTIAHPIRRLAMPTASADSPQDDQIEMLFERGVTDGLPVVPPTRERVERMLARAPWRRRDELIGLLGPQMG